MREDTLPEFQSEAAVAVAFGVLDNLLRADAAEHGLEVHSGHGRSTWIRLDQGEFGARRSGDGAVLYARAHRRDWLFALQDALVSHLAQVAPEQAADLRWSALDGVGAFPPPFSLARVESVRSLGADFLRLRLRGEGLRRLAEEMVHFRLVLPPAGDPDPQWPVVGPNGQTVWPGGAKALHRPAYTVSAINPDAGWLETDIFAHQGGRVCEWAQAAQAGDVVGLNGPGGGGLPVAARVLMGGDETAYPALARALAANDPQAQGECWLFGARADYPFPDHPGIRLIHHPAGEAALAAQLEKAGCDADKIWLATEKARLAPLKRAVFDSLGIAKSRAHLAAYWIAGRG
ncbi:siderophore-interacting protein [Paracoccus jiaweipingae]|uniref:siderophore-interacting protein n=1 Tax=unclassified Paracoccus (in: a-proteobacteria) TaxID=2688777 RepID=UPI0037ADF993